MADRVKTERPPRPPQSYADRAGGGAQLRAGRDATPDERRRALRIVDKAWDERLSAKATGVVACTAITGGDAEACLTPPQKKLKVRSTPMQKEPAREVRSLKDLEMLASRPPPRVVKIRAAKFLSKLGGGNLGTTLMDKVEGGGEEVAHVKGKLPSAGSVRTPKGARRNKRAAKYLQKARAAGRRAYKPGVSLATALSFWQEKVGHKGQKKTLSPSFDFVQGWLASEEKANQKAAAKAERANRPKKVKEPKPKKVKEPKPKKVKEPKPKKVKEPKPKKVKEPKPKKEKAAKKPAAKKEVKPVEKKPAEKKAPKGEKKDLKAIIAEENKKGQNDLLADVSKMFGAKK